MRRSLLLMLLLSGLAGVLPGVGRAQAVLGHSPNIRADWLLPGGQTVFVLNHRFEIISGGDALISIPTLTLGVGLPRGFAAGLDFSSNSEIVPERLGGNETQFWIGAPLLRGERTLLRATGAYNQAARSVDGALTARARFSSVSVLGELRAFSSFLGGDAGSAAAGGLVLHLTPHLELAGDAARALGTDTLSTIWSAGVAVRIPGTPHTFSLHVANAGALTLQGLSRPKVIGPQSVRYGFTFTVPLGTREQWVRIFRRAPPPPPLDSLVAARVDMRVITFTPQEVRVSAGEAVAWYNMDPVAHTVAARDGSWRSALLAEGERFVRVFTTPGRYEYYCEPHPQMTGVVIVGEPE